jgi:hypothetical protein
MAVTIHSCLSGQHLVDHPLVPVYYSVNSTSTFDDTLRNTTLLFDALTEWITQKEGLLVSGPGNTFGLESVSFTSDCLIEGS